VVYPHKHHVQQQFVVLVIFAMVQVQNLNVELATFVHLVVLQNLHAQLELGLVQLPYQHQHLVLTVLLVNIILIQLK
jgi:hypothetical protein